MYQSVQPRLFVSPSPTNLSPAFLSVFPPPPPPPFLVSPALLLLSVPLTLPIALYPYSYPLWLLPFPIVPFYALLLLSLCSTWPQSLPFPRPCLKRTLLPPSPLLGSHSFSPYFQLLCLIPTSSSSPAIPLGRLPDW